VTLYVGTSGFSYPTWKGVFYPKNLAGSKMLDYYSHRLNGVELNGSFYRTPPETTLAKWRDAVPESFRFCMKAHRGLTYSADAFDRVGLAAIVGEKMRSLGGRLGPMLLQFPPVRQRNAKLLDDLLSALQVTAAAEFRHESWFCDEIYTVLRAHGAALVVTDEEKWPRAPLVDAGPSAYFRLRRDYSAREVPAWAAEIRSACAGHEDVHVYFKHEPEAPGRALRLARLVTK
jgi:uncharacterized protein YecE (DUF72 family)